jgi:ribosomal protein L24
MSSKKPLHLGQILVIQAGTYKGHGARVVKIGPKKCQVIIEGKIRTVSRESLGYAD